MCLASKNRFERMEDLEAACPLVMARVFVLIDSCRDLRHLMIHDRGHTSGEVEATDRPDPSHELEASVRTGFCRESWRVEALAQMQFARDLGHFVGFDETATQRKPFARQIDVVGVLSRDGVANYVKYQECRYSR